MMLTNRLHFTLTNSGTTTFALVLVLLMCVAETTRADTPLFFNDWLIETTIEAPFSTIMRVRSQENEIDGIFRYTNSAGEQVQLDVKLRVRGAYRARKDVCKFAPLRLNFRKKQVRGTEFSGQDKLKLVTHCNNSVSAYEQFILKEFLNYRLFAELTDSAFRTRLLRVTYIDSDGKSKTRTKYAFLIEHQNQLAERLGIRVTDIQRIKAEQLNPAQTNIVNVFSHFIGNTDFSTIRGANGKPCCHNVTLFEQKAGLFLPIPYDFDLSGMVNASYASPNPKHRIDSVSKRLYLGLCRNNALLTETFNIFRDKRDALDAVINNFDNISTNSRKQMQRYVNSFYKILEKDARIKRAFIKACL